MKELSDLIMRFSLENDGKCIEFIELLLYFQPEKSLEPYIPSFQMAVKDHTQANHFVKLMTSPPDKFRVYIISSFNNLEFLRYVKDNYTIQNFGSAMVKRIVINASYHFTPDECLELQKFILSVGGKSFQEMSDTVQPYTGVSFNTSNPTTELQIISLITTILDRYEQNTRRTSRGNIS